MHPGLSLATSSSSGFRSLSTMSPLPNRASLSASIVAPTSLNASSECPAPFPAPDSMATSAPSRTSFLTVSGVTDARSSPGCVSRGIASRIVVWPDISCVSRDPYVLAVNKTLRDRPRPALRLSLPIQLLAGSKLQKRIQPAIIPTSKPQRSIQHR